VFSQQRLPDYNFVIEPSELDALVYEYEHRDEAQGLGLDPNPYHPIQFQYDGQDYTAHVRLKGSFSWNPSVTTKMQFVVSFNENGTGGRFFGLRKLEFDAPYYDPTLLRNRIALAYLRDRGLPAQCANSAKISINGDYYGVYVQLERIDHEFLERVFPEDPDGDLWKSAVELHNNETTDPARLDLFKGATTLGELEQLCDMDQAIGEWASEAMIPHGDGFWGLERNYFIYDHKTRGFVFIPFDLDASFEWTEYYADPIYWTGSWRIGPPSQFLITMADGPRRQQFIDEMFFAHQDYNVDLLAERIDDWSDQISQAVAADPNISFTFENWEDAVRGMRDYLVPRSLFVGQWLDCQETGVGVDSDNDGFVFCHDCDDTAGTINPGAEEICGNDLDDDCDGRRDEGYAPDTTHLARLSPS